MSEAAGREAPVDADESRGADVPPDTADKSDARAVLDRTNTRDVSDEPDSRSPDLPEPDSRAPDLREPGSRAPAASPAGVPRWSVRSLSWYLGPLLVFLLTRLVEYVLIDWSLPARSDQTVRDRLESWDTGWFVRIAQEGYPAGYTYDRAGHLTGNGLAFFPAFPMLVRAVHAISGLGFADSALVAGTAGGALATLAVYALGTQLYDRRVGIVLATLFCTQPMSVVLCMGYSEGLFVAFVAAALVAARRAAWLVAGVAGLGAALSRPTGAAAALAVVLAAGVWLWSAEPGTTRWRAVTGSAIALAGVPGYLIWVGARAGSWRAWFDIQTAGWGTTFDWGDSTRVFLVKTLRNGDGWAAVSTAWLIVAVVLLAVVAIVQRTWSPLLLYGLLSLVLVVGQAGYYHSKPRLMVPVLVVLVPLAVALGRAKTRTTIVALAGYAAFGLWYGSYMLTTWGFAI